MTAIAFGADALDQRALRHQFDLHQSIDHFFLCLRIEADMTRNRFAHQASCYELSDADAG